MNIPAIRAHIGDWTYYVTTLTFEQVNNCVSKIDDQLHKSENLRDLIQRSITNNYKSIKDYIMNQSEFFFNSLVLAVYDDYPDWREIEFTYQDNTTYKMGLLEFPSKHRIFPVDGQHRVEGIKEALKYNPDLKDQQISVIFIGHKNDDLGKQRTRRLFSTLNRYAKPVTMDDIIALDEDDSIAIATRSLLENHPLFEGKRVTKTKNKAIPDNDKDSLTSIITLYQCNRELLKIFRKKRKQEVPDKKRDNLTLLEYLKFRPNEKEIELFENFVNHFWNDFKDEINVISAYLQNNDSPFARLYRNREDGGNLLFRPVGLLPIIQAVIEIHTKENEPINHILNKINLINFSLIEVPWKYVVWNPTEKTMIMGNQVLTKLLLKYMYNPNSLTENEKKNLIFKYADIINYDGDNKASILNLIPLIR